MTEKNEGMLLEKVNNIAEDIIEIKKYQNKHTVEHSRIWSEIAVLKVKAGVWGLLGGSAIVGVAILISKL